MNDILINPATNREYENVPTTIAAKFLDTSIYFIRESLKLGTLPIGTAVQGEGGRWSYLIPVERLKAYKKATDLNLQSLEALIGSLRVDQ